MEYRVEKDSLGEVKVPSDKLWGAQTQRSLENFRIGTEKMPAEITRAFAFLKKAAADTNFCLGKLDEERKNLIARACDEIIDGKYSDQFPLAVWQTGSGTQSNMNINEVVAHIAKLYDDKTKIHPNDHVNMSQSSNDTFPTAMHISAVRAVEELIPCVDKLIETFAKLEAENDKVIKVGRTHLQDAVPLTFGQEVSGWRAMLEKSRDMIKNTLCALSELPIGATAVGTGLNAPKGFDTMVCEKLSSYTGFKFVPAYNKFYALTSKNAFVFAHGAMKALAADLFKIANDVRFLASGPRCGIGELFIPENEPGSSIMPGKVNPTQCEALTMVCAEVMGNDVTVGIAAASGNFELNVYMPVLIFNFLRSARLLYDAIVSFDKNCASGIRPNIEKMRENLDRSLMLVTCLTPYIGYDNAASAAKKAHKENTTVKEAVLALGFMDESKFDEVYRPEKMV